jgi:hypothetical protein
VLYLGTHRPHWLAQTTAPLCVSDRTLRRYRSLPVARGPWVLDSGGFTELQRYGSWQHGPTPKEYIARVRRYRDEIGGLVWASPQDWMAEPIIRRGGVAGGQTFAGTGLPVVEHQRRTVENFLELRTLAPELPIIPVLQGWAPADYLACALMYADAGVELAAEPTVGLGSVCRRQGTAEAAEIISALGRAVPGIRLHGYGIKTSGLRVYGSSLFSADSMAWSFAGRKSPPLPGCTGPRHCGNCPRYAFRWREQVLASLAGHLTRTPTPQARWPVSRKLDTAHEQRLTLAAFRDQVARLERDHSIRAAHANGMSVRAIAATMGLSPARVGQVDHLAQASNQRYADAGAERHPQSLRNPGGCAGDARRTTEVTAPDGRARWRSR